MTRRAELLAGLAVILGLMVLYAWTHASASVGPLLPVSDTGSQPPISTGPSVYVDPVQQAAVAALCGCAPIDSFGSACDGLTWDSVLGFPVDFRTDISPMCRF